MYKIHVELTVTVDVINFIQPFISCVLNMIPKLVLVSAVLIDEQVLFCIMAYEYTC